MALANCEPHAVAKRGRVLRERPGTKSGDWMGAAVAPDLIADRPGAIASQECDRRRKPDARTRERAAAGTGGILPNGGPSQDSAADQDREHQGSGSTHARYTALGPLAVPRARDDAILST